MLTQISWSQIVLMLHTSQSGGVYFTCVVCSRKWKQWIQSRGRSFIFSTALPIPVVTAAYGVYFISNTIMFGDVLFLNVFRKLSSSYWIHNQSFCKAAAIVVAREEKWRQHVLWERVRQLSAGIGVDLVSPIAPIIIGSADEAVLASRCATTSLTDFFCMKKHECAIVDQRRSFIVHLRQSACCLQSTCGWSYSIKIIKVRVPEGLNSCVLSCV